MSKKGSDDNKLREELDAEKEGRQEVRNLYEHQMAINDKLNTELDGAMKECEKLGQLLDENQDEINSLNEEASKLRQELEMAKNV